MPINGGFSFRKCVWSMEKKKLSLPKQIGIALLLGILAGYVFYMLGIPEFTTNYLKPFGTIFVNLLKFIVVPVVLLSMIDGIISMGDMKKVGSVGWKTVAYFLVTTAAACVIGLVFANLFNNAGWFPTLALEDGAVWDKATSANFMDTLVAIFPSNMWKSFTDANMLQVIVIALMFGGGILAAGEKGKLAKDLVSTLYAVIERVMAFIIALSPIGVFTMMAWVVATQGPEILGSLAVVLGCAYLGYIVHAVLCYSFSAKAFAGISPFTFFEKASPAMIFAFTSTSSAATIPLSKECADELGAESDVSSFVIPLGATINMDGAAITITIMTLAAANTLGMQVSLPAAILLSIMSALGACGASGVAGGSLLLIPMACSLFGISNDIAMQVVGVGFIIGVIQDSVETALNSAGDVEFAATAEYHQWLKQGKPLPEFLGGKKK